MPEVERVVIQARVVKYKNKKQLIFGSWSKSVVMPLEDVKKILIKNFGDNKKFR